jgi:hypothetical protein
MRQSSLYVDYDGLVVSLYDPLAVGGGLLHGLPAPAMYRGWRVTAILWFSPVMRDPLTGPVGVWPASVGKDPRRRDRIADRVAPAMLDLWRAGACP